MPARLRRTLFSGALGDRRSRTVALLVSLLLAPWGGFAWSGTGLAEYDQPWEVCGLCHSLDGNSRMARFPRLAGLPHAYIRKQLHDFLAGRRWNDGGQMTSIVTEINIADIDRIASWFADQVPPLPVLPDEETGPGEQLYLTRGCVVCHSSDASADVEAPVPYLTSQHAQYLAKQIQDFQRGDRVHAGIEATDDPVAVLTENEIDQLVVHPFETF